MQKLVLGILVVLLGFASGQNSYAQPKIDFPTRPITLQVPWIAGGGTDVGARILASIAEKKLAPPTLVPNKVGASSQIGLTELARQKPDGYYIGFISTPHICTIILDPE